MVKTLGFLSLILLFTGCALIYLAYPNHPAIYLQPDTSNSLQLNGYYYTINTHISPVNNQRRDTTYWADCYFLYKNGCSLFCGSSNLESNNKKHATNIIDSYIIREYLNTKYYSSQRHEERSRSKWGKYRINGDSITISRISGRFGEALIELKGKITNNSSFIINQIMLSQSAISKENGCKKVQQYFELRKMFPKPDSTNSFTIMK